MASPDAANAGAQAAAPRVLASTTSHKREPLLPTLEVFSRLDLRDIDLNLHHVLEEGVSVGAIVALAARRGLRIWVVSGGWCDFFHPAPGSEVTDTSVDRQVNIASQFGANCLRLFFGRLAYAAYSPAALEIIRGNLCRLSDRHPQMVFVFENHDGASLHPGVCREILEHVGRPNIRMNFDPINFERVGVNSLAAVGQLQGLIGHVHLKGLDRGEYCEFGAGDVNLAPVMESLDSAGYRGSYTVEYEGPHDGTLRLYQSIELARSVVRPIRT